MLLLIKSVIILLNYTYKPKDITQIEKKRIYRIYIPVFNGKA